MVNTLIENDVVYGGTAAERGVLVAAGHRKSLLFRLCIANRHLLCGASGHHPGLHQPTADHGASWPEWVVTGLDSGAWPLAGLKLDRRFRAGHRLLFPAADTR